MKSSLLNRGFLYGCAGAILFVLAKTAKYGGASARNEAAIIVAFILACGLIMGCLWQLGRLVCIRISAGNRGDDNKPSRNRSDPDPKRLR